MAQKTLVFLESVEQYETFLRHRSENEHYIFCSLTPHSRKFCEDKALPFVTVRECSTQDAYTEGRLVSETGIQALRKHLNDYGTLLGEKKINFALELGNYVLGLLLPSLGSVHHRAYILKSVIEYTKPDKIIAFTHNAKSSPVLGILYPPDEVIFAKLLKASPYASFCTFLEIAHAPSSRPGWMDAVKSGMRSIPWVHDTYELHKYNLSHSRVIIPYFLRQIFASESDFLFVGPLYHFANLLKDKDFAKHSFQIYWGEQMAQEGTFSKFPHLEWKDSSFNFDICSVFADRLALIYKSGELCCSEFSDVWEKVDRSRQVLSSCFLFPLQQMAGHIAKKQNKPVMVWTHGSKGIISSDISDEANDLIYSDSVLTFGDGVNEHYRRNFPQYKGKSYISVGSSASFYANTSTQADYILYVTGKYSLNMTDFSEVNGVDDILYDAQNTILEYLKKQTFFPVIWKKNPTRLMGEVPFDSGNLKVVQFEQSFLSLLPNAALVIFDSPSSATVEACASYKALFTVMERLKYTDHAQSLLEKRVVVTKTTEEMLEKVDEYLRSGKYQADLNCREFARAYSTHLDDGKTLERVASVLRTDSRSKLSSSRTNEN